MSRTSRHLVLALRLLGLAVIGLHLAVPMVGESAAWGLWPVTYLPPVWRWLLAAVAAGLVLGGDRLRLAVRPAFAPLLAWPGWSRPGTRAAVSFLAAVPFFVFRLRHLRWGDAYILSKAIPHPQARLTYVWQAPLDVFIHAKIWQTSNRLWGWPSPIPVYWVLSAACGVAFVWLTLSLAAWLGRDRTEGALICGLLLTLGTMELFFGYVENYSFMVVGVLLYLWLALRTLRTEIDLAWPAIALALTHAFHPSTIILFPSLLYLAYLLWRSTRTRALRLLATIAIPYFVVLGGVFILMSSGDHGVDALLGADFPGGGDRRWLVPLTAVSTRWEHYTMFSLGHLLDILNQQFISAPVIWPALILTTVFTWPRLPRRDEALRLLLVIALSYLLLILVWNPDYGGQRDWDLFSPAAIPGAVLLAYVLCRVLPERPTLRAAGWALIAAQAFHTLAWIYQNTLPQPT